MAPTVRLRAVAASMVLLLVPSVLLYLVRPSPASLRETVPRHLGGRARPPPPQVPAELPSTAHLRVVVRTMPREALLLQSLIYNLRAQADGQSWLTLDFVLVPTEPGSQQLYRMLRDEMSPGFDDIEVLDLPDAFYAEAKASNPFQCTAGVRAEYAKAFDDEEVHKYCDYDHYQYYAATDRALRDLVAPSATCTHVLVTNGDNGYAPAFLDTVFRRREDLVVVPFLHDGGVELPVLGIGGLDLGAVLVHKRVLDEGRRVFMTSLPAGAGPKEVHDADYWFVRSAIDAGMSYVLLFERVLMYHH